VLELTEEATKLLITKGTNVEYGARPLRRAIEGYLEDPLAEQLLRGEFAGKDTIIVRAAGDDKLIFEAISKNAPAPPAEELVGAGAEEKK